MDQPGLAATAPHALVVGGALGPLALMVNDGQAILDLIADLLGGEGFRVSTRLMAFWPTWAFAPISSTTPAGALASSSPHL